MLVHGRILNHAGGPAERGVEPVELPAHVVQDLVDQRANSAQRMILRDPLFGGHVTKQSVRLAVVSSHARHRSTTAASVDPLGGGVFQQAPSVPYQWLRGDAGLRCGEMMAIAWDDVDLHKRQLCVQQSDWKGHLTTTKGGRLRYVPMTGRLAAALHAHRHLRGKRVLVQSTGEPLTQKIVQIRVARAARLAGVRPGVHILRHTFCSHLAMRGAPARAIQDLAGHQDLTTTQRYMHLSPAALEGAIRLLDASRTSTACDNMLATGSTESDNIK